MGGNLVLLQTSLDALAAQTGLSLFEIYGRDGRGVYPDPDGPDANLIWLEREYLRNVRYVDNTSVDELSDERSDACSGRRGEISKEVARTLAATPAGIAVKMRLLRNEFESLKAPWADQGWETCLTSLEKMNGESNEPEAEVRTAHAAADIDDDDLLRLERELAEASAAGNAVATDEDAEPLFDGKAGGLLLHWRKNVKRFSHYISRVAPPRLLYAGDVERAVGYAGR